MKDRILELIAHYFIRSGWEKAEFYKKHHWFHAQGENCFLPAYISKRESYLVSIGNNVWLTAGVHLVIHDASVQVVKKALNYPWIDKIGRISIGNNVFVGNNAMILPGVSIGNYCVVGGGAVVTKSIPDNSVVAGNPAKFIEYFDEYGDKCLKHSNQYPWDENDNAEGIKKKRIKYFWEDRNMK